MSATGRNDPCRCGSGKKTKRCCGVLKGPSPRELARAFVANQRRRAVSELFGISRSAFDELFDEMLELPTRHLSMQVQLPRIRPPELEELCALLDDDDDDDWDVDHDEVVDDLLDRSLALVDNPERRAELARAVLALVDGEEVPARVGNVAMIDLDGDDSELMRLSLLQAVCVSIGAEPTPSGLLIAGR